MAPPRISRPRAMAAWLVTGPVGFLLAGTIDWLVVMSRYTRARVRGRDPWG